MLHKQLSYGIGLNIDRQYLNNLRFADDIILLAIKS